METVKDKMTYYKVEVTYNAYREIVPNLTSEDKAMILAALREAREEAMDGGSADEKSAIFQKYKDQINARLSTKGFDVAKATKGMGSPTGAGCRSGDPVTEMSAATAA